MLHRTTHCTKCAPQYAIIMVMTVPSYASVPETITHKLAVLTLHTRGPQVFRKEGLPKQLCHRSAFAGKKQVCVCVWALACHAAYARAILVLRPFR